MRIVYCIGSLASPGGAENVLVNKANYFADTSGYDVHILIADQANKPIYYTISNKVSVHDLAINKHIGQGIPLLSFYSNIRKLKKVYRNKLVSINPDIILVLERGYADFVIPQILKNIPKIRETHSSMEAVAIMNKSESSLVKKLKGRFFTFLYKKQLIKYDHVVLLTERDRQKRYYLEKTSVIPNTIKQFTEQPSTLQNKIAISVGRLDRFKNFNDQILIWNNIVKKYPDWKLHIYGVGSEKEKLEALINSLELSENVKLLGKSQAIGEAYSNASLFLFTSLAEGFGIVLVEAMQFGIPVISYDCPCGPGDIIEDETDGFLIPVGDVKSFEKRIIELIENSDKRKKISHHAILKSKEYLPEVIMKKWEILLKNLINGK